MNPNPPPPPPPPSQPPPYGAPPPYGQPLETTTWWQRNKKWAIPVGCVGAFVIAICCGLGGFAMYGGGKLISMGKEFAVSMQAVNLEAKQRAAESDQVMAVVGDPVNVGEPTNPQMKMNNGERDYRFDVPVSGPKGSAMLHGHASSATSSEPMQLHSLELDTAEGPVDILE